MSTRIRDLVEIIPLQRPTTEELTTPEGLLSAYLLTYESGDAISRVVENLAALDRPQHNCLLVGGSGSGKSTLLSAVTSVYQIAPDANVHSRFHEMRSFRGPRETLVLKPGAPNGTQRIATAVTRSFASEFTRAGFPFRQDDDGHPTSRLDAVAEAIAALPSSHCVLVALDDLDDWLRTAGRFAHENLQTLIRLGELSRSLPLSVCAVVGAGMLFDDSGAGESQGWMAALVPDFRIEYLPSHTVRTATASKVLKKNARQRRDILEVLGRLREKLPDLNCTDQEFVELYPLEVSTWNIGGHLHRLLSEFSFPEFAASAASSVRGRPSISLFALNDMFARYEAQLRRVPSLDSIFASYDELVREALPRLGPSQRLWGRLALQSIFMHTVAGLAVDVATLTNSVLLYSLHGGGSSYALMAAVLKQLEALGRGHVVASGEGHSRRYALVSGQRDATLAAIDDMANALESDDELTWELLGLGVAIFSDWPIGLLGSQAVCRGGWDVVYDDAAVTIAAEVPARQSAGEAARRPRLVILAPGRTWSEAREVVQNDPLTVCWIGGSPTPSGWNSLRRWVAVKRLSAESILPVSELNDLRSALRKEAAEVFQRAFIERGMLIYHDRSEALDQVLDPGRSDNLVVRLIPDAGPHEVEESLAQPAATATAAQAESSAEWLAHLIATSPDHVDSVRVENGADELLALLESWYTQAVALDVSRATGLLTERDTTNPDLDKALEVKQQFDVAVYYARRALSSGSLAGLGESLESVFESYDNLWAAKARLAWLCDFALWLDRLASARRYLDDAKFALPSELDQLRTTLTDWIGRIDGFIDTTRRQAFDEAFEAFRGEYSAQYLAEHHRSVRAAVIDRLCAGIFESPQWTMLESLSSLSTGDPAFLVDATNLVSTLRAAQCDADAETLLQEQARCVCGYQLGDHEKLASVAANAVAIIQGGIQHNRQQVQARKSELRAKLKARKKTYDVEIIKTIAVLASDDDITEIDSRVIAAINELVGSRGA